MEPLVSFSDFPDDVQLAVLSFLSPAEISAFACTSRHFSSLCSPKSPSSSLYLSMCNRRWGSKTLIPRWTSNFPLLYRTLDRWDPLIGFWRRIGNSKNLQSPPLVLFEWGPSCITGSRVSPSNERGSYGVVKKPFLWLGISKTGEPVSCLSGSDPESDSDSDLVPVNVSFMGGNHVVIEESGGGLCTDWRGEGDFRDPESPPDRMTFEIYQYFANKTSPGGDKVLRKQRKKKVGRMRWDAEHFVKIENSFPTPARPLQGLWKGICESMFLDFYLVTHDDVGGISCRRVGNWREPYSDYSPVFWTSSTAFLTSPFSREEEELYSIREHLAHDIEEGIVSRILCINSSYELVLPNLSGSTGDPRNVEGRIWEYKNGEFGFGFLRNNFIVDLKHIALNGCLLDTLECSSSSSP